MSQLKSAKYYNLVGYYVDILYKLGVLEGRYLSDVEIYQLCWSERVKVYRQAKAYAEKQLAEEKAKLKPQRTVNYRKLTRSGFMNVTVRVSAY
jgi:hypothetical protein